MLTIDADAERVIFGPGASAEVNTLKYKRRLAAAQRVQFTRGATVIELPNDATGIIEFKIPGRYDEQPITGAASWTKFGSGSSTYYVFLFALINDELDARFGVDVSAPFTVTAATDLINATAHGLLAGQIVNFNSTGVLPGDLQADLDYYVLATGLTANAYKVSLSDAGPVVDISVSAGSGTHSFVYVGNDVASIDLIADIYWIHSSGTVEGKTQTLTATVENDVTRDGDTIPGSPAIVYSHDSFWRSGSGVPSNGLGLDGDFYINTQVGAGYFDVYMRDGGVYSLIGNIRGATGPGYTATSATSFAVGTGSKAFTTQASLAYTVGARARVTSAANTANWMEGLVTAYSGTTLTNQIDKTNGSGTHTDWNINLAGEPGATGATGSAGANGTDGATPAITQNYSSTTSDADPGSGIFRLNHATVASATAAYLDNNESGGSSIAAFIDTFDDSTSPTRGFLIFKGVTSPTAFAIFKVTGSVVDGTGYRKLTLTYVASGGTFTNGNLFGLSFERTGDATTYPASSTIPSGATPNIDWATVTTGALRTLAANTTFAHINMIDGKTVIIPVKQDTSPRTVSWTGVDYWLGTGGVAPTQSTGSGVVDVYTFFYDGTKVYGTWAPGV